MNKIKVLGRNVVVSLSVLLVIFALGLGISKVYSTTNEVKSIDELLVPYQEVLDEINAELGCTRQSPDYPNMRSVRPGRGIGATPPLRRPPGKSGGSLSGWHLRQ